MDYSSSVKRSALFIAVIGSFIIPFMGSAINVALPAIEDTFKIDAVLLSWIATAYLLAAGVSLLPSGRLADIKGRKKVLTCGFSCFAIASLCCALSPSAPVLIFFRICQGFGSGMVFATSTAILVSVFPPHERGKVLGITVSAVYIGLSSGPFIGGILTLHLAWRSLFFINFILSLIVIIILLKKLKGEWADAKGEKFDYIGTVIYGTTLVLIIYGLSLIPSAQSLWLIFFGLLGLIIFAVWEMRTPYPIFEISLLVKNQGFAFSNLAALIHYSATFAVTFLLSLYLQYIKSFDPQITGLILISQPIMMATFSPLAGRLSDRIDPRIIATSGMFITGSMIFGLSFIQESTSVAYIITCLLILGIGYGLFSSPNMNAIMSSIEKKYLGIASGSAGTMRVLGQLLSMGIATLVLARFMGRNKITESLYPALLNSIKSCLIIFSIVCILGMIASLARGNIRSE